MTKYVVFPEGQPSKARYTNSRIVAEWYMFIGGLGTMFPDPRKARRMTMLTEL